MSKDSVTVIGAGLAGCEAAWRLAEAGISVQLIEQKPKSKSPAHHRDSFAELVCSNSLGASRLESASGLLKEEMRRLGSICVPAAEASSVEAGGALAVDREQFSERITDQVKSHERIRLVCKEQADIPSDGLVIIATGPLTSDTLAPKIAAMCGGMLSFYDAAAPIVTADSIDMEKAFTASRYDRGEAAYINCPMDKQQYEAFYEALVGAETVEGKAFDRPKVYEGCMPVERMAARGADTIRFGPMKPVGLRDPRTGHRPWAVVQLRRENAAGTLYNLVGFQTSLRFSEQKRVFSMIPALHDAEFVRYGVMHRNTFIDSPRLLNPDLSLKNDDRLFFAGQITGVEGYMPSASSGILAGINAARRLNGQPPLILPPTTMIGALTSYITDAAVTDFQPMGANFGILPPLDEPVRDKRQRYEAYAARALKVFDQL